MLPDGVKDRHDVVGCRIVQCGERLGVVDQLLPLVTALDRGVGKRDRQQRLRYGVGNRFGFVQFAEEQRFCLAVANDVGDGVSAGGRIDRHGDQPGHRDCQIGEQPFGAVLGEYCDLVAGV